jgi:hypothetical protein
MRNHHEKLGPDSILYVSQLMLWGYYPLGNYTSLSKSLGHTAVDPILFLNRRKTPSVRKVSLLQKVQFLYVAWVEYSL